MSKYAFPQMRMLASAQSNTVGAQTMQRPSLPLPASSTPTSSTSQTVVVSNWATIPNLTLEPTSTVAGAWWSLCNKFLGMATTTSPPPTTPYVITSKNANVQGFVKGYLLTQLLGSANQSSNDVVNFDYQAIITRIPKCDVVGVFDYFLVLLPFPQPGSQQTYTLYNKTTQEGIRPTTYKGNPRAVFRLVLTSTTVDVITGVPTVISDSAIIRSNNAITPCGKTTQIQVLSNSSVEALVSVPNFPTANIQYKALLNIRSSNQSDLFPMSYSNPTPFPTSSSNIPSNTPTFTVNGDVIDYKIQFTLIPNNASSASVTNASNQLFPTLLEFTYTMFMSGGISYPQMTATNSARGTESADFLASLIKGIEFTRSTTNPNWIIAPNQMMLVDFDISFTTPIPLSSTAYNPQFNGNPNADTRDIVLILSIPFDY